MQSVFLFNDLFLKNNLIKSINSFIFAVQSEHFPDYRHYIFILLYGVP